MNRLRDMRRGYELYSYHRLLHSISHFLLYAFPFSNLLHSSTIFLDENSLTHAVLPPMQTHSLGQMFSCVAWPNMDFLELVLLFISSGSWKCIVGGRFREHRVTFPLIYYIYLRSFAEKVETKFRIINNILEWLLIAQPFMSVCCIY